jgi:hypothetical protein
MNRTFLETADEKGRNCSTNKMRERMNKEEENGKRNKV